MMTEAKTSGGRDSRQLMRSDRSWERQASGGLSDVVIHLPRAESCAGRRAPGVAERSARELDLSRRVAVVQRAAL